MWDRGRGSESGGAGGGRRGREEEMERRKKEAKDQGKEDQGRRWEQRTLRENVERKSLCCFQWPSSLLLILFFGICLFPFLFLSRSLFLLLHCSCCLYCCCSHSLLPRPGCLPSQGQRLKILLDLVPWPKSRASASSASGCNLG